MPINTVRGQTTPKPTLTSPTPTTTKPTPTKTTELPFLKPQPRVIDTMLGTTDTRALVSVPSKLKLPGGGLEPITVPNVELPKAGSADARREYLQNAARRLGYSDAVIDASIDELIRRDGDQTVVDLKTKKPLLTVEDFAAADDNQDGFDNQTFSTGQLAVFRDVNTAYGLGLQNVSELYALQEQQFTSLQEQALSGTDVDLNTALAGVSDPTVKTAMRSSYDALRAVDELGHGDPGSVERLGALKDMLIESQQKLPANHPLRASIDRAVTRVNVAQKQLLDGTKEGGKIPPESMAALNNLALNPLGRVPDEAKFGALVERTLEAAQQKGATEPQLQGLRRAMESAYALRAGQTTSAEGLQKAREDVAAGLKAAGPLVSPRVNALLATTAQNATVGTTPATTPGIPPVDANNVEKLSGALEGLKEMARAGDLPLPAETLDAMKNFTDAVSKDPNSAEAKAAALKLAPNIVALTTGLVSKLPHLAPQAADLLDRFASVAKLPVGPLDIVSNAKKVFVGRDLDGKEVSETDRIKAGAELALDNVPSLITTIGTIAGASKTGTLMGIAGSPVLAIPLVQVKMMMMVLDETKKGLSALAEGELRDRFDLKQGENVDNGLLRKQREVTRGDTSRLQNAERTAQDLLQRGFTDIDTQSRFQRYAAQRLGKDVVDALRTGRPLPGPYSNPGPNTPDPVRAAKTIEAARELQKVAKDFLEREVADTRNMILRGSPRGSYIPR